MEDSRVLRLNRRDLLKFGGAAIIGSAASLRNASAQTAGAQCNLPQVEFAPCAGGLPIEAFPTSPLIGGFVDSNNVVRGSAFTQLLPVPEPLAPEALPENWDHPGQQDSLGHSHQVLPSRFNLPAPVFYRIKLQVAGHMFTNLKALPINALGQNVAPPGRSKNPQSLPASTIYGFNGKFPGPMIKGVYGRPVLVRFENELDRNPFSLDRNDFGDPEFRFLTHLHNAHTAPESDGNPHFNEEGYHPCQFVNNLYLNYPPDGDEREKQSFWWFHDHFEGHTGANVYKGMVGLYPVYDPMLDPGDERSPGLNGTAVRLPGVPVKSVNPLAPDRVEYDIPIVLFDCALDDGVTAHKDFHNGCGETHPEWWGQTYFRHFPDHGFVGDIFTVNGVAYPILEVKRRRYRFRFLDASIARVYRLSLMASRRGPKAVPGMQGQYLIPDGQQCMRLMQIASEGGLLPFPIVRNNFDLWPAKRREFVVDFSKYQDGSYTDIGDEIYLTNTMVMDNGRGPDGSDPDYKVPLLKFVITGDAADESVDLSAPSAAGRTLRELPAIDFSRMGELRRRRFSLERSNKFGGEIEWLINDRPFDGHTPLARPRQGQPEVWVIESGGGWGHPMHIHQEEHQILSRNGVTIPRTGPVSGRVADDVGKEDTIALNGSEEIVLYRNFRTFEGPYVAHCHNLAHEDHSMMFGWEILPPTT